MNVWDWYLENELLIRSLVQKFGGGDELYEEVWDRLPRLFELYDESKGKISSYVYANLRWYLWKKVNKRVAVHAPKDRAVDPSNELVARDEVQSIIESVDAFDAEMLILRHLRELTYKEIGIHLGVNKTTARKYVLEAEEHAREARVGRQLQPERRAAR
jgi:DNA-directed RNA polymerase specialized sigma24 family protein